MVPADLRSKTQGAVNLVFLNSYTLAGALYSGICADVCRLMVPFQIVESLKITGRLCCHPEITHAH